MLSVCLITRNEEAALPRAIASVQPVADEIIIADTGSSDRTEEVARKLGATVVRFPWADDFSAARNFAIAHATGDWILWLDADEELLSESVSELRSCLNRQDALAFFLQRRDLQQADRLDDYTVMWQLRLFRRRGDLRFIGRCHPHFETDISEASRRIGLKVETSSIALRHYGYVGDLRPAKLQRGARLLALELHDRPGQFYYLVEYGRTLLLLQDERGHDILAEAAVQLLPRVHDSDPPQPMVAQLLEYFLSVGRDRLPPGYNPELINDLARRWFPDSPPLLWLLARRAAEGNDFREAERILRTLIRMGVDHSYDKSVSFDPGFIGRDAKANLAVCLVRQMRLEEARAIFRELLGSADHAAQARSNLEILDQVLLSSAGSVSYSFNPPTDETANPRTGGGVDSTAK